MEMVNMIREAYITAMGIEKWNSMSGQEQHDAVMFITRDLLRRLEA